MLIVQSMTYSIFNHDAIFAFVWTGPDLSVKNFRI